MLRKVRKSKFALLADDLVMVGEVVIPQIVADWVSLKRMPTAPLFC